MKIKIVFALAFLGIICMNCDTTDDLSPLVSSTKTPVFFLLFEEKGESKVDVEFSTNSMNVIPTVTVDDETLKMSIDFHSGLMRGELHGLEYKKSYQYKIAVNRKKTSGDIKIPSQPDSVQCNGTLLNETRWNVFSSSDTMKFSWSCQCYDNFRYVWDDGANQTEATINETNIFFIPNDNNYYTFNLVSITGPCLGPGTYPNVRGDCGDGYVLAISEAVEYNILTGGGYVIKSSQGFLKTDL